MTPKHGLDERVVNKTPHSQFRGDRHVLNARSPVYSTLSPQHIHKPLPTYSLTYTKSRNMANINSVDIAHLKKGEINLGVSTPVLVQGLRVCI
jgi:hypothetical protein